MSSIKVRIEPTKSTEKGSDNDTFKYTVQVDNATPMGPATPMGVNGSRELVQGVKFGVTLGDRLIFRSKNPFTVFFRYGRPDRGDYNSTDEQKQTRSQPAKDEDGQEIHQTSIWALLLGLYEPVITQFDADHPIYDRGLCFEVRPAGA